MADLIKKYFREDLSDEEYGQLIERAASEEEAERFLALAKEAYGQTGLPEPRWGDSRKAKPAARWWFWLMALLVVGWAALHWMADETAPAPRSPGFIKPELVKPIPVKKSGPPRKKVKSMAGVKEKPTATPSLTRQGDTLGVVIRQKKAGKVRVRVLNAKRKEIRLLFQGSLDQGEWRFEWDGVAADGKRAPAGTYRIEVQTKARLYAKEVQLR